jgi:hypothetical protein
LERKTIAELMRIDSRTGRFGPHGLMTDRRLTDESAVEYIQAIVSDFDLPSSVPEQVREHFETLRRLHTYGAFSYDLFAMSTSAANTAIEFVLGVRFVDWYSHGIPLVEHATGARESVVTDSYEHVRSRFGRKGRDGNGGWYLEGDKLFDGSLASLLRWARSSRALGLWLDRIWSQCAINVISAELTVSGPSRRVPDEWTGWTTEERAAWVETTLRPLWEEEYLDNIRELRNLVAHRTSTFLTTPVQSAQSIRWLAELVTCLWPAAEESVSEFPTDSSAHGGGDS